MRLLHSLNAEWNGIVIALYYNIVWVFVDLTVIPVSDARFCVVIVKLVLSLSSVYCFSYFSLLLFLFTLVLNCLTVCLGHLLPSWEKSETGIERDARIKGMREVSSSRYSREINAPICNTCRGRTLKREKRKEKDKGNETQLQTKLLT